MVGPKPLLAKEILALDSGLGPPPAHGLPGARPVGSGREAGRVGLQETGPGWPWEAWASRRCIGVQRRE
jgi:hypothetical protein